jgi:DNA-binding CsgD family transcriptional regulator
MRFSYRPARPSELAPCFTRFGEPLAYPTELRPHVPTLWRQWVEARQMVTQLIEDQQELGCPQAVGFGAAVFVAETFASWLRTAPSPFARAELVRRTLAGESVVLDTAGIRAAQRGKGLSVFFISDALTNRDLSEDALHLVHERWSEALYELRAFRLSELFWETTSTKTQRWSEGCGLILRQAWPSTVLAATGDPDRRLYLIGLNSDEVRQNPGTHASYLFAHTPARFGFTARQQELLHHALEGQTDTSLAKVLHLSLPAVKKRWAAIYDSVSEHAPGWLESAEAGADAVRDTRGAEKRRRLLHYLRQHPEELHPSAAGGR